MSKQNDTRRNLAMLGNAAVLRYATYRLRDLSKEGEMEQWLAYLLEQIEAQMGPEAIEQIGALIKERVKGGGW